MLDQFLAIFGSLDFYAAVVRMTTPLLLAAMGGLIAERAGIITFSMEGMMLLGTVGGVIGSGLSGNVWVGVLCAMAAGIFVSILYALMAVSVGANQVVSAVALNMGVLGLSSLLYVLAFAGGSGQIVENVIRVPRCLFGNPCAGRYSHLGRSSLTSIPWSTWLSSWFRGCGTFCIIRPGA